MSQGREVEAKENLRRAEKEMMKLACGDLLSGAPAWAALGVEGAARCCSAGI